MKNYLQKNSIQNMMTIEILIKRKKTDFFKKELNKLSIHEQLSKLDLKNTQMDFDASDLYPSAMWDKKSVYPEIKSGFAFQPQMNDVYVGAFN